MAVFKCLGILGVKHCGKQLGVQLFRAISTFSSSHGHSPEGYTETENTRVKTDVGVISPAHSVMRESTPDLAADPGSFYPTRSKPKP